MKRRITITLCLLLLAALLASCAKKEETTTWIIAADRDLSPFVYEDESGNAAGMDVDILNAIAVDQGFRFEIRLSDWDTATGIFSSHQAHVLMGSVAASPERADSGWFFSQSYYAGITQSMAMEPSSDTNTLSDLAGKAVAVVSGTLGAAYAQQLKDPYGFSIATFSESHAMYNAVLSGQAAACFEDTPALRDSIASGVPLQIVEGSQGDATDYCVAVCKEENLPFLDLFNAGLAHIRANGIYDSIVKQYGLQNPPS